MTGLLLDKHIQFLGNLHKLGILPIVDFLGFSKVMPSRDITDTGNTGAYSLILADSFMAAFMSATMVSSMPAGPRR